MRSLRSHACQIHRKEKQRRRRRGRKLWPKAAISASFQLVPGPSRLSSVPNLEYDAPFENVSCPRKPNDAVIDSKEENLKRLVVREINIVSSVAIPECERGRFQPNVVEIIALVTEARGRLMLLIKTA